MPIAGCCVVLFVYTDFHPATRRLPPAATRSLLFSHMEFLTDIASPDHLLTTPPDYSSSPLPGEKCIQRTPTEAHLHERSAFTYGEQNMSLTLRGCREEDGIPTFGFCSNVRGEFAPTDRSNVISVVAELQAQIVAKGRRGLSAHILFSKECLLWRKKDSDDPCPGLLPLSISFPSTYRDKNHNQPRRLPPSMSVMEPHRLDIAYSLKITVRKTRCSIFTRRIKETCISAYLRYSPRVRPPRPTPIHFSEIKNCPEEWQEDVWGMSEALSKAVGETLDVQCDIFVPSVRVFSWSEPIPFHLSFSSSSSLPESTVRHLSQTESCSKSSIRIFLLRKTTLRTNGSKSIYEEVLGVGRMTRNTTMTIQPVTEVSAVTGMSWDGEVCCERPIKCASFTIGVIEVRDFLVFSLQVAAPGPLSSIPPQLSNRAIPIRLVTHPWIDRS